MEKITTVDFKETENLGLLNAQKILSQEVIEKPVVIVLNGELGAGKTTFLQGFAKGLDIKQKIQSPTFLIMNRFRIRSEKFKNFYHFDCYRLDSEKDLEFLDFKKIISDPENIICIEWGNKIKKVLPKNTIKIDFKVLKNNNRQISIK
jgi:tRNA threonylcarbamoyladenosine biosynthesis protein TsaE